MTTEPTINDLRAAAGLTAPPATAASILTTAGKTIGAGGDRNSNYGDAIDNFTNIGNLWAVVFGHPVSPEQVAICSALIKVSRLIHTPTHLDSWVDGCGYLALGGGISQLRRDQRDTAADGEADAQWRAAMDHYGSAMAKYLGLLEVAYGLDGNASEPAGDAEAMTPDTATDSDHADHVNAAVDGWASSTLLESIENGLNTLLRGGIDLAGEYLGPEVAAGLADLFGVDTDTPDADSAEPAVHAAVWRRYGLHQATILCRCGETLTAATRDAVDAIYAQHAAGF
ncbi:DUF6378 domain-containing protein [Mycolicibacterium sphagni]|uniref:DUF6378 domain-containing protein n=1 Tax=Mycolicibacterium sphagni TaxID=1786 RepID=UPI0021F34A04|nr:DUF6378 domain-containing protein [Mycolicibacterium sphagni]MCV7174752.1 hypothetical protein [Mycolicibacterium sphagni]